MPSDNINRGVTDIYKGVDEMENNRAYLGDGVYAEFDGMYICLHTENAEKIVSEIYLDLTTFRNLEKFAEIVFEENQDGSGF